MLKVRSSRLAVMIMIIGLMAASLILVACGQSTEAADNAFGLRAEAAGVATEQQAVDDGETGEAVAAVPAAQAGQEAEETVVDSSGQATTGGNGHGNGNQAQVADRSLHTFDPATAAELTVDEIEGLLHMREEEKLARDVYLTLYESWGAPVFQNIAGSEQAHMDSVLMLLAQYELSDPAAGKAVGEFENPQFQSLYEQLVAQGQDSLIEALKVGAAIEELDIVDLQAWLSQTGNEYLVQVYSNLLAGSENHLRAFVSNMERQSGEIYEPVYLSQAAYEAIMTGAVERGNGNGSSGGGTGGNSGYGGGKGRRNGQSGQA